MQVDEVVTQVLHVFMQVLQILLSEISPYSLELVQATSHFLVPLFPHKGSGQPDTQAVLLKNNGELQLTQFVAEPVQVAQLLLQVLQILLSVESPNSLELVQLASHFLVLLFPQLGVGQAVTQVVPLRYKGELHVRQLVAVPEHVAQLELQVLQILLSDVSPNSLQFVH